MFLPPTGGKKNMPKAKRIKTSYTGVYYILGNSRVTPEKKEKIYYIRYKINGKLIEEKAGCQHEDKMTPSHAARIRNQKIEGKLLSNIDQKKSNKGDGFIDGAVWKFDEAKKFELSRGSKITSYQLNRILNAIFRVSTDGISICDSRGNIVACNEAISKISGLKLQDIVGKNPKELIENRIIDKSVALEVIATKRQINTMISIKPTKKQILATGTPVFDEDGNIEMIISNERDMTQLNNLKEKLDKTRLVKEKYKDKLAEIGMLELKDQEIIVASHKMRQVLKIGHKFAKLGVSNILLLGESGTGKNLLSKFIYNNGARRKKPFIDINCAAIPESLLEAELFGYEKGAFTGAGAKGKVGLFELAHEGTLFLDEIGDLPLSVQAKLLKYLDNQEILHLGGIKPIKVDCIIITATNRDLKKLVNQGDFREDLFYRLNSVSLHIPPMRDRREDIFKLAYHFLNMYNQAYGFKKRFSPQAIEQLLSYRLPGNVRELKNIINSAVLMSEKDVLEKSIVNAMAELGVENNSQYIKHSDATISLKEQLLRVEKNIFKNALSRYQSTREIAKHLKLSQSSVVRKLKHHSLMT